MFERHTMSGVTLRAAGSRQAARAAQSTRMRPAEAGRAPDGMCAAFVVLAVALVLTLESLRVLFTVLYSYRETSGLGPTVFVFMAVFTAPVVAVPLVRRAGSGIFLVVAATFFGVLRLLVQVVDSPTVGLAGAACAAGLITVIGALLVTRPRGVDAAVAIVVGLALDTLVRGAWSTWDLPWQRGLAPLLITVALVAALVAAATSARSADRVRPGATALPALVFGPYLALELLFLQSPAFVASSGRVALPTAVGVVLAGDLAALGTCSAIAHRRVPPSALVAAGMLLAAVAWMLPTATGIGVLGLLVVGQVLATLLLTVALDSPAAHRPRGTRRDAIGVAGGVLLFGLVIFAYQLHYDQPLPVSNRWLPGIAGGLLMLAALAAHPSARGTRATHSIALLGGAVTLAGVMVVGGLAASEPDLTPTPGAPVALRVVTYNVHEAVTRDGRLDPAAMTNAIARLRPDVVVVEEAGRGWPISGMVDLAEWTKRRLRMPYTWGPAADHQFGNLVFSRLPVISARVVSLPQGNGTMRRSAVIARIGPVDGAVVTVIGVHLQNGNTRTRRHTRINELHMLLRAWHGRPHTVIAGDLNSDPGSPELQTLLDARFTTTQPTQHCTLTTSNAHCVDWILVTPDLEQGRVRVLPLDTFDHRPLHSEVRPR